MDAPFFLSLIALPFLFTFAYAGLRGAPWVPTRRRDVDRCLRLAEIRPGMTVVDLGCGNGTIIAAATRAGAQTVGYEISLLPYVLAKLRSMRYGGRMRVEFRDFWNVSLRGIDCVYCFLLPKAYPRLREKLERELTPGSRVIIYVWPMEVWTPERIDVVAGQPKVYRYIR